MDDVFTLQTRIGAAPPAVYRALTEPAALRGWLAEHAEVELPGRFEFWGRYTPQGEPGRQRLLAAEPDRRLSFAWTLDGRETTVDLTLAAAGPNGTLLTCRQDGAPTLAELMAPTGRRDGLHSIHTFWPAALAGLADLVEGREPLSKVDFSADRAPEIRIELTIAAAPEQVFASLVDPKQVASWFGWEPEIEPRVGGRITLGADGRISEFEPGRRLVYGDQDMVVRWELEGSAGRTRLTFVQSGYSDTELDNAAQHEAGWLGGIAELRRMHELGADWQAPSSELPE